MTKPSRRRYSSELSTASPWRVPKFGKRFFEPQGPATGLALLTVADSGPTRNAGSCLFQKREKPANSLASSRFSQTHLRLVQTSPAWFSLSAALFGFTGGASRFTTAFLGFVLGLCNGILGHIQFLDSRV